TAFELNLGQVDRTHMNELVGSPRWLAGIETFSLRRTKPRTTAAVPIDELALPSSLLHLTLNDIQMSPSARLVFRPGQVQLVFLDLDCLTYLGETTAGSLRGTFDIFSDVHLSRLKILHLPSRLSPNLKFLALYRPLKLDALGWSAIRDLHFPAFLTAFSALNFDADNPAPLLCSILLDGELVSPYCLGKDQLLASLPAGL
ncbi:hypothetical protein JCM8547_003547, partial [Rhodosporidiobolus lusitaniae]